MVTGLTAYLCRRTDDEHDRRRFEELVGSPPTRSLTTAGWAAHLLSPAPVVDDTGQVGVVLHGEVYGGGEDAAPAIATSWSLRGRAVALELNGSWALLVADRARDELSVVTDRLASRRLFCSVHDGAVLISSALAPHRRLRRRPDPVGVASFLVNGRAYAGRTVLDGVRLLERASVHRLTDEGFVSTPYWEVRFDPSNAPEDELRAELSDRLAAAVARCLFDAPTPFLALSGGKDSRGIAGELRWGVGREDVECFTFVGGAPRPGSDEDVAARIAGLLGFPHRLVKSWAGDLVGVILDNAVLGEGNTNVVHEVAGWRTMAERFASVDRPVVLTGDQALGWEDVPLRSPQDVLDALVIYGLDAAPELGRLLPRSTHRDMAAGMEADRAEIWSRCSHTDDLHDAAEVVNIDQRLPHVILPWREAIVGSTAAVRRPLLDAEILDLVTALPTELRRGKRLYGSVIEAAYPALARMPLVKDQNFRIDHLAEVPRQAAALRELIDRQSSVVDDLVPPDVASQLLVAAERAARSRRASARHVAKRLAPAPVRAALRSRVPHSLVTPTPPSLLLIRLLILRAGLPS